MYRLFFDTEFKKDYDKLAKDNRERIKNKLQELKKNPELGKHLIGLDLWSLRIGKYRALYQIKERERIILVLTVNKREKAYRRLR